MGYLSIERLEGSYNLQEVVKDYIPRKHTVNYYDLNYLKIVRTPNCHKLVGSEIVGEDYSHYVYFWISVNQSLGLGKSYHGGKKFPDSQEGYMEAEKYADHILLEYHKNKHQHPKKWKFLNPKNK